MGARIAKFSQFNGTMIHLFVVCLVFNDHETDREGTFQMVVEACSIDEAAATCRARLDELANTTDVLGPIRVYSTAILEVSRSHLVEGVLVNLQHQKQPIAYDDLPTEGVVTAPDGTQRQGGADLRPFWSGVDVYWSKWKLYWCETDDDDTNWFVVARNADDARLFHQRVWGSSKDDARAELVCVLPLAEQAAADKNGGKHWPSRATLRACGIDLRGSENRWVRTRGHVFSEGRIVGPGQWCEKESTES
jgi:hypothetical protein